MSLGLGLPFCTHLGWAGRVGWAASFYKSSFVSADGVGNAGVAGRVF